MLEFDALRPYLPWVCFLCKDPFPKLFQRSVIKRKPILERFGTVKSKLNSGPRSAYTSRHPQSAEHGFDANPGADSGPAWRYLRLDRQLS